MIRMCGLHGDDVMGVISLKGESIAGYGLIFTCTEDCHPIHH